MVRLGSIEQIDALFTDRQPPEHIVALLSEKNVALHTPDNIVTHDCSIEN
jgi:DeoR family glycerol-3-phosphate regulon repressor